MEDFNDVCGSKQVGILKEAGLKDAWWEGGDGATIHHLLPFRIDYIVYLDRLQLMDIKKIDINGLFDHDVLMATFKLN